MPGDCMRKTKRVLWVALSVATIFAGLTGLGDRVRAQSPTEAGHHTVVVNPNANGNGTARTIQQGIDMVAPGGKVLVRPGTYPESLVVTKGLTLESIGQGAGPVIIAPSGAPVSAIEITTTEPVTLRDLTVHVPGLNGIRGDGEVDLTVEGSVIVAVNPPTTAASRLITVSNDGLDGSRSRMVVRDSFLDGAIPNPPFTQSFALQAQGNVDAVLERNVIRRVGGACIFIVTRTDLGGELNADILDNDLDECHPFGRVASIIIGPFAVILPSATHPVTATGVVNIIGNTIRNSSHACLTSAISYEVYGGLIERNRILDVVQSCATPTGRNRPGAIWIGRLTAGFPFPPVTPSVRFNDIQGNAYAGLRIAPNQTIPIDASCNYWGSQWGPSGIGPGDGDAILVEPGGASPLFTPFATAPIAGTTSTGC